MCCYKPSSLWKFAKAVIEANTPGLVNKGFPGSSDSEESACNAGDPGSVPGLGRFPGGSDSEESACNAGDPISPWIGKIPWRRE